LFALLKGGVLHMVFYGGIYGDIYGGIYGGILFAPLKGGVLIDFNKW
jgi:hypothetical protein